MTTEIENNTLNSMSRARLSGVKDDGDYQTVDYKAHAGEQHSEVYRIGFFGIAYHPPAGSEGFLIAQSQRDMPFALGFEHKDHRPRDLPEGGMMLYDTAGSKVFLDADGVVNVEGAKSVIVKGAETVNIEAADITLKGKVKIEGDITHTGNMTTSGTHTDARGVHN